MGMFDTIHCNYDLGPSFHNRDLQTKDLECFMSEYWLDPSGQLWQIDYSGTQDFIDRDPFPMWEPNGNHGKVKPFYITKDIEVYPAEWNAHYAAYPRQTITFVEGKLCMKS